jgi:hypothetical protein
VNMDAVGVAPTTQHLAAFRYDTVLDGSAFWRTVTNDGAGPATVNTSSVAVAANTPYVMRVACGAADCKFYINGSLVATHTTTLPGNTTLLLFGARNSLSVAGSARNIKISRIDVYHN